MSEAIVPAPDELRALITHHQNDAKFAVERHDRDRLNRAMDRIAQLSAMLPRPIDF